MSCVVCFLSDSFQNKLRNLARLKVDRFENAIVEYKNLYISQFEAICNITECSIHKNKELRQETVDWCNSLHESLKEIHSIDVFFDEIKDIYVAWVGGKFSEAIDKLDGLLSSIVIKDDNAAEYIFCIRGRKSSFPLQVEDLYHIPFNKRRLISNQRYSITGLPLLYLGLSPVAIFHELRTKYSEFGDLYFSSFVLKNHNGVRVADLTNIYPHIYSTFKTLHESECKLDFSEQVKRQCQDGFRSFIFSSICSFQIMERYEGSSFVEEYVLPQLLSERLRIHGYDGLSYSSTRVDNHHCYSDELFYVNKYRENFVLFTKYSDNDNYDQNLLNKFHISRPVRFSEMVDVSDEEISRLRKEIIELNNGKNMFGTFVDHLAEGNGIKFNVYYEKLHLKLESELAFKPYKEHDLGKIHSFLVYQHMLSVRNWWLKPNLG